MKAVNMKYSAEAIMRLSLTSNTCRIAFLNFSKACSRIELSEGRKYDKSKNRI